MENFERSESIKELMKAVSVFQLKMDKVKKDSNNPFFNSKYASIENILDAISIPLQESELVLTQMPVGQYGLFTMLCHIPTGQFISSSFSMEPSKKDPQGAGSVITYQRRYAIVSTLCLNIEQDDDANAGTHGAAKQFENKEDDNKPWLNEGSTEFEGAVKKMKEGKSSIKALREYFKISKKVEQKLNEAVAA